MGSVLDLVVLPGLGTHHANCPVSWRCWELWHQKQEHSSQLLCKTQLLNSGTAPGQLYPKSIKELIGNKYQLWSTKQRFCVWEMLGQETEPHPTCIVTNLSSTITSFVRKSAPMVALYWLLNFLFTYWFISEVLPTLERYYGNSIQIVNSFAHDNINQLPLLTGFSIQNITHR